MPDIQLRRMTCGAEHSQIALAISGAFPAENMVYVTGL